MSHPNTREISFRNYQITAHRTQEVLGRLRDSMHVEPMPLTEGRDYLDRYQLSSTASFDNRGGERVGAQAMTEWYSDGSDYHLYMHVAAFTCAENRCGDAYREIKDSPNSGLMVEIPEREPGSPFLPTKAYRGDFNGDGRIDLMFVLENGRSLVFEQTAP